MSPEEVFKALERGDNRFIAKRSKRIYVMDPAQREVLKPFEGNNVLLIGFPEVLSAGMKMRRYRGRKWVWLSPAGIELAPQQVSA